MSERDKALRAEKILKGLIDRRKTNALDFYVPYPKQQEFHDMGMTHSERLLRAGNQLGKTEAGAFEMAMHLTGRYPDWWLGHRFKGPIKAWAAGITGLQTRDVVQKKLLGEMNALGTGSIPKDCLDRNKMTLARGISDLFDTIPVKHVSGESILRLKTYEQGREKFQGDAIDLVWFDEEPPLDVYIEALARLTTTDGLSYITFTPLKGETDVILRFMSEDTKKERPQCGEVQMRMRDALHMTPERIKVALSKYPEWQHEARINGEPMQGSGRVFSFPESDISIPPFPIPAYWSLIWGVDFGVGHPFAAVLLAWDKDADVLYVTHCVRMKDKLPIDHVAAMKPYGLDIPVAWPQDGTQRKEFEGQLVPFAKIYKHHGLRMQDHHATFADGSNSTEVGIQEMQERMRTGKFKVFNTQVEWFDEYRSYHRNEEGLLVKVRDDIMSATRVGLMAKRGARIRERFVQQMNGGGAKMVKGDGW
jgi:phage terminase large subunit-like protein